MAHSRGPQLITRHGKEAVVVLPAEQFEQLLGRSRRPQSLVEMMARSPLARYGVKLEREPDYGRPVEL